jgi:CRISPR-associated protein Cas1
MEAKGIFKQVCSRANLYAAWIHVEGAAGCGGIDGVSLARFSRNLESELDRLHEELVSGRYVPLPLAAFMVPKPGGGQRQLCVAVVRDRIVQRAIIEQVVPLFEAQFEESSFAYRHGRSVKQALEHIQQLRDTGFTWVAKCDLKDFFGSVDHKILFEKIDAVIRDKALRHLIGVCVRARVYDGHSLFTLEKGLAQGAPLSPMLANLYLDVLDERLDAPARKPVRYADDLLVMCKTKRDAAAAMRIAREVTSELKLALNEEKSKLTSFEEGFKYLGAAFTHSFCVVDKNELDETEKGPARLPPHLEILHNQRDVRSKFNTELADELKAAAIDPPDGIVPTFFMKRESDNGRQNANHRESTATASNFPPPSVIELRTLYIHEHGAVIRCRQDRLIVEKEGAELASLPFDKIDQLILIGNSQLTTSAIKLCLRRSVPVYILEGAGRLLGTIEAPSGENVVLQIKQFQRMAEATFALDLSRRFVQGKISNCRAFLQRRSRQVTEEKLTDAISVMQRMLLNLDLAKTVDAVRGYEGAAAAAYYSGFSSLFASRFSFTVRTRRPPRDPVNAMLSLGYTLLFQNIYAMVRARGLSPSVGVLHELRQGHPALCSDLIEEFRAPIVDSLVVSLINKKQVGPSDFGFEDFAEVEAADTAVAVMAMGVDPQPIVSGQANSGVQPTDLNANPEILDKTYPVATAVLSQATDVASESGSRTMPGDAPANASTPSNVAPPRYCRMADAARKTFVLEFERKMATIVRHPGAGIRTTWRGCIDLQIGQLIKVIREESPHYLPFEFK